MLLETFGMEYENYYEFDWKLFRVYSKNKKINTLESFIVLLIHQKK